jgi:hypothetical protein
VKSTMDQRMPVHHHDAGSVVHDRVSFPFNGP